jgi:hypothetical protein
MKRIGIIVGLVCIIVSALAGASYAWASSSSGFYEVGGDVFDDWTICRTRSYGEDGFYQLSRAGFRPVIAFESLGENVATAYNLGQDFAAEYPDSIERAEAVFYFVRDRVSYASDIDVFGYEEFAQNADELADIIGQNRLGHGDCEDSAVLLAVMCRGAGLRSAIAVSEEHTAALIYLPDYKGATVFFELDGEDGWIWAEATGPNNPLGWVPKEFINVQLEAYEVTGEALARGQDSPGSEVAVAEAGGGFSFPFPFLGVAFLLWIVPSLFRRRRRAR